MTEALSDISRTNQLKITQTPEEVAEKLFLYLFKVGKGIEHFSIKGWFTKDEYSQPDFYEKRHKIIKSEIQKRLSEYGERPKYSDIQYFFSYSNGENYVFFLSPNKTHSGWKRLFCEKRENSNRERILNLIFKFHILSQGLPVETINGFEELLLIHSTSLNKSKDALFVWGQNLFLNYNYHNVLTLTLSRKSRLFLPKDHYNILDGEEMGELLVYKKKNYYFERDLDARRKNSILFMRFDRDNEDFDTFKKTQLYYYQNLMTKLENFLGECDIAFGTLHFQADHYMENSFIKNVESVESLEVINNTGVDLTEFDKQFLQHFLKHQGVSSLTFYNSGKTVSIYEQVGVENEEDSCWKITEIVPWSDIELDKGKNYLVFNKLLEEEAGSMAYRREDGFWYPSTKINSKAKVDFYSQLKRNFNYLETGEFFSTQGMNVSQFRAVGDVKSSWSVLNYTDNKIDKDILRLETQAFTDGKFLDVDDSISCYLIGQEDGEQWEKFCDKHKIKISSEFQKVLIELGIKNWIRESLVNPSFGLPITPQSFLEKQFFTIYVRSPRNQETKAVAVEFIYKEGCIYIKDVMRDIQQIKKRFPFLRTLKNKPDVLKNDQQYFVDETNQIFISCYTDDFFTPTLIGRNGIIEDIENGKLEINRQIKGENSSRLLPLVSYYNGEIKPVNRIQNMVCLDLKNKTFIQYYVPPGKGLDHLIKRGFRVYHLIGKIYSNEVILTPELIKHPITALHFSTLTQNVLRISDNSQSSLLQKVAKVFVEN